MSYLFDLFIPNRSNNYRAKLLKPQFFSFLTLIFVCSQIFINFFNLTGVKVLGFSSNITPERIIELTNQKRAELGLSPLKLNGLLSEAARRKAGDMFAFNYWAHNSPSGRDPWSFFKEVGYKYRYAGENLARDFRDPESVVQAWMNSPSHKENIVNGKYQEIGVAVVDGSLLGVETTLVVQLFGSQATAIANKQVVQPSPAVAKAPAVESQPVKAENPPVVAVNQPVIPATTQETVTNKVEGQFVPIINPFSLTKILSIFLVGVIFGAFFFDFILVSERKTPRLSGRSFAQLLFLGFIILLALISKQGAVI